MRSLPAFFSVTGQLGAPAFADQPATTASPILPDTIVQWTRLITAGIIP